MRVDPSWLLIALLVIWTFLTRFGEAFPTVTAATMAVTATALFFASVLAHELAHGLEAKHRDLHVEGITLFLFGGVTEMHAETERPRDEFVVAAVGPYISLVCAAVFGLAATFSPWLGDPLARPVSEVAGLLAWLNLILAVFNLVPGAPLDGGRVLRAGLWALLKDRRRAAVIAARSGQLIALALVLLGVRSIVLQPATAVGAIWLLLIGWFMWSAARQELRQVELDRLLHGRSVRDVVTRPPLLVPPDRALDLIDTRDHDNGRLRAVADAHQMLGVLDLAEVERMHQTDRSVRTAGDIMTPLGDLPAVALDADIRTLVRRFSDDPLAVRVVDDGRTVGLLTESEVAASLEGFGRPRRHLPRRSRRTRRDRSSDHAAR